MKRVIEQSLELCFNSKCKILLCYNYNNKENIIINIIIPAIVPIT